MEKRGEGRGSTKGLKLFFALRLLILYQYFSSRVKKFVHIRSDALLYRSANCNKTEINIRKERKEEEGEEEEEEEGKEERKNTSGSSYVFVHIKFKVRGHNPYVWFCWEYSHSSKI